MLPAARFLKLGVRLPSLHALVCALVRRCTQPPVALILILMLGAGLRFYNLAVNPPELFGEEIDTYLSVRSIVTTGKDVDGSLQPFLATPYERHGPIYGIAGYLSSLVFGNGAFGLRFPAAAFGIVVIALLYGIAIELTKRRDIALTTALFTAIGPLFIHFSRIGWITDSMLPVLLGGLYALLRALDPDKADRPLTVRRLLPATVLLAAATYTYHAAWFYVLVLGGSLIILNFSRFRSIPARVLFTTVLLWGALAAPAFWELGFDPATNFRFHDATTKSFLEFMSTYIGCFSWHYLVSVGMGDQPFVLRELTGFGGFYWWMVLLMVIGLIGARSALRTRWMLAWIWIWLVTYPLGAAFMDDGPNAGRTLAGAPVLCIFAALGLATLLDRAKLFGSRRDLLALRGFFLVNVAISTVWFCTFYFGAYPRLTAKAWESGTETLFELVRAYEPDYTRLCIGPFWIGTKDTYLRYYVGKLLIERFDNIDNPACFKPGTLLVSPSDIAPRPHFAPIAAVLGIDGELRGIIAARPNTPPSP